MREVAWTWGVHLSDDKRFDRLRKTPVSMFMSKKHQLSLLKTWVVDNYYLIL